MRNADRFAISYVTTPSIAVARRIAKALLKLNLIACANIIPSIESHYCWKGKHEKSREALMILKSRRSDLSAMEKCILQLHPYETPEIISIPLHQSTPRYLAWLQSSTQR